MTMSTTHDDELMELRLLNAGDLRQRAETSDVAAEQLRLRRQAEDICWTVLAGLGCRYTGTGGWHIGAYVDEDCRLGFVNIACGVAVSTDVVLDPAVVQAATVPDQPAGPQVSGAVAWTAADPGEAHHASAPDGWTQLAVDLRARRRDLAPTQCQEAYVVAWALKTCYDGKPGVPGYTMLDGQYCYPDKGSGATADEEAHHPLDLWPETDTMPELRRIASDALNAIALDLATYMPDPVAAKLPDINAALKLFYSRGSGFSYDAAGAADHVVTLPGNLLAGSPLSRLHRLANAGDVDTRVSDRSIELIGHVVTHVLRQRLTMVADQLASFLGPLMTDDGHQTEDWRTLRAQLGPLVAPLLDVFLRAAERRARDAAYEAVAAYTAAGPISVRIRTGA